MHGVYAWENKSDLNVKRSNVNEGHHFSNFGRPPVPNDLCLVLEKIFKGFYHIREWRPSWSMDRDHFSKSFVPLPQGGSF